MGSPARWPARGRLPHGAGSLGRRAAGFALYTAITVLTPLVTVPAVTSRFGADGWAAIATAQSLGAAGAVAIDLGFGLIGTQRVARMSDASRRRFLAVSLRIRLVAAVVVVPLSAGVAMLVVRDHVPESGCVAAAAALFGLSSTWFFVGTAAPARAVVTDAIPRLAFACGAAIALSLGAPLAAYAVLVLVAAGVPPVLAVVTTGVRWDAWTYVPWHRVLRLVPKLLGPTSGRLASAAYITLPVAIVALVAPQAVAVFSVVERLQRFTLAGMQLVPNALQGWVAVEVSRRARLLRARRAAAACFAIGILAATVYAIVFDLAVSVLFSGIVDVSSSLVALSCGVIVLTCASRGVGGIWLVALGDVASVSRSAFAGAVVGLPSLVVLAWRFGAAGGLVGELVAEAAVLARQLPAAVRRHALLSAKLSGTGA